MTNQPDGNRGRRLQAAFEAGLWHSRWLALVAVIASLVVAVTVFVMATVDVAALVGRLPEYIGALPGTRDTLRLEFTGEAVKTLDSYLLGVILLIFALGLYELFIAKIESAEGSAVAQRLLLIRSLDDLKHRLAGVVLLKLVVKFFQVALKLKYETATDLLALAAGTALIGLALMISVRTGAGGGHGPADE